MQRSLLAVRDGPRSGLGWAPGGACKSYAVDGRVSGKPYGSTWAPAGACRVRATRCETARCRLKSINIFDNAACDPTGPADGRAWKVGMVRLVLVDVGAALGRRHRAHSEGNFMN
jgi:hypothetical protein